ncbi:MAG TPA: GGDEF domain-containing protein [Rudaea sp.]
MAALIDDKNPKTDRATILEPSVAQETPGNPRLIIVSGLLLGHQIEIGEVVVTIGRAAECTIALPHPSVSRMHCRIWREDNRYHIQDLDSTNRTYLNGKPVMRAELRDGDQIGVGSNAIKFFVGESMEARYHDELIDLAIYDSLTGFYNRRHFLGLLADEIEKSKAGRALCLLMLDLDYFKSINDRHGHLVGDQALSSIAQILREQSPPGAVIGRFGGEEFSMLLREVKLPEAIAIADRLRAAIAATPLLLRDVQLSTTISIGVAEYGSGADNSSALLHAADEQLYRAKQGGRNRVAAAVAS